MPPETAELVAIVPSAGLGGAPRQHLDLEILASYLRERGRRVALVDGDLAGMDVAEALADAVRRRPLAVYWHLPGRRQLQALAGTLRAPVAAGGPIQIAGGYFASRHDLAILESVSGLDAVVHGELEGPVAALLAGLARGEPWAATPGLAVRREATAMRNPPSPLLAELDGSFRAADDLFHPSRQRQGQRVLLSRGCNSDCSYCGLQVPYREAFPERTRFWRSRSPGRIADEIEYYVVRHGIRYFRFEAYVFFGYDRRGEAVIAETLDELERRGLQIEFSFVTHPRALVRNRHLLPRLRSGGLRDLVVGIDSGLERALRWYRVEFGRTDIVAALATLHDHGIPFDVGFFCFDPRMTFAEIREQLAFLRLIRPFFGHMRRPYSYFLDQQLLATALHLNSGMPLLAELDAHGLLLAADPLLADPSARFADPQAGRLYAAHFGLRKSEIYRALRPRLLSPAARSTALEEIPLAAAEDLWSLIAERPDLAVDRAVELAQVRLSERLKAMSPDSAYSPPRRPLEATRREQCKIDCESERLGSNAAREDYER